MKNMTRVDGYDKDNKIIATGICPYENRYGVINKILNTDGVVYITTTTIIER